MLIKYLNLLSKNSELKPKFQIFSKDPDLKFIIRSGIITSHSNMYMMQVGQSGPELTRWSTPSLACLPSPSMARLPSAHSPVGTPAHSTVQHSAMAQTFDFCFVSLWYTV